MAKEAKEQCSIIFDGSGRWACVETAQDFCSEQWKPSGDVPSNEVLATVSKKYLVALMRRAGMPATSKDPIKQLCGNLKEKWQDVCSGAGSSGVGSSGAGSSGAGSSGDEIYDKMTKVELLAAASRAGIKFDLEKHKIGVKTANKKIIACLKKNKGSEHQEEEDGSNQDKEDGSNQDEEDGSNQDEEDGSNQHEEDGSNHDEEDGEKDA